MGPHLTSRLKKKRHGFHLPQVSHLKFRSSPSLCQSLHLFASEPSLLCTTASFLFSTWLDTRYFASPQLSSTAEVLMFICTNIDCSGLVLQPRPCVCSCTHPHTHYFPPPHTHTQRKNNCHSQGQRDKQRESGR